MTSRPVTEIGALYGANAGTKVNNSGKSDLTGNFTQVLSSTTSGKQNDVPETGTSKPPVKTNVTNSKPQSVQEKKEPVKTEGTKDEKTPMDEKVKDATDKVIDKIKDTLDVSDEDIKNAMETLGLTMTDLLNTDNVTSLVTELTGAQDMMSLVTDEALYTDLKDILGTVSEVTDSLLEELDMTPEEFTKALEDAAPAEILQQDTSAEKEPVNPLHNTEAQDAIKTEAAKEPRVIVVKEDASETAKDTVLIDKEAPVEKKNPFSEEQSFSGNGNAGQSFQNMFLENTQSATETPSFTGAANTEQILQQIAEQIKITMKPDSTSMELQLNPASLGRVGLQIEQKAGGITAQFTAQNEAVKAAIESQVVQLRENLESQGIKIDSVEVTIASHEFERNLQQNNSGSEEKQDRTERVSRRRLNLNAGEDEEEELTEEETLAKEIMMDNGNRVDYTA